MRTIRPDVRRFLRPFCLLALAVSPLIGSVASAATVCATPGKDGVGSGLSGVINTYYAGSGTASGTTVTLGAMSSGGATTAISAGDLILIMQMQDGSATDFSTASTYGAGTGQAGLYEYATVAKVSGSTLTLSAALTNTYTQSADNRQTFQVVRVPQYSSATVSGKLTAQAWTVDASGNGTGGVLAMDVAGALTLNANLDVSGEGFRGGLGINGTGNITGGAYNDQRYPYQSNVSGASKGEGTAGTPLYTFNGAVPSSTPGTANYSGLNYTNGGFGQGAPGNAGGGANDGTPATSGNQYNAGGGGGANAGAGGQGGYSWSKQNDAGGRGGYATSASTTRLFLGGGGGAGGTNNNSVTNAVTTYPPTSAGGGADGPITASGASGGGAVLVRTGSLSGSGQILANGYRAYNMSGGSEAAGAGGAGGSVLLLSAAAASPSISVNGGAGGNSNYYHHGPGGGGGGGYVLTSSNLSPSITNAGGSPGTDSATGTSNYTPNADGAVKGSDGVTATTAAPSGAACLPSLTVTKSTSTPTITRSSTSDSSTASYTIVVQNGSAAGGAVGVNITDPLPSPFTYTAAAVTPTYSGGASGPSSVTGSGSVSGGVTTVTFGTAGGTSANSFYIPQGGSVSLTFSANLGTASSGTYQNPASANFSDPTRTASATTVSPGGSYAAGGTVGGSNYDSASSGAEDVTVGISYTVSCPTVLAVANVTTNNTAKGTLFQLGSDGTLSKSLATLSATSYALGRDPMTGFVYYFNNSNTSTATLYYYDLGAATGGTAATVTGTGGGSGVTTIFTRLGFRQDGTGYAMLGNGTLYKVVPAAGGKTATVTSLGALQDQDGNSLSTLGGGDFAFDKYDNAWAIFTDLDTNSATYNQSVLYKIDLSKLTGGNLKVATRIGAVTLNGAKANLAINGLAFNTDNNSFLTDNNGNTYSNNIGQNDASNQKSVTGTVSGSTTVPYDLASCFYPDTKPTITVSKSVASSATPVVQGTQLTYSVTVHNGGNAPATGVSLKDAIPANTTYVANSTTLNGTAVADSGTPTTMPYASGGAIRSPDAASGAPTASGALTTVGTGTARDAVVTFKVTVNSGLSSSASPITNTATATYDNPQSGGAALTQSSNQTQTPVVLPPNIALTKLVRNIGTVLNPATQASTAFGTSASGKPGDYLEYCVSYNNTGSGSATGLTINDSIAATGPASLNGYGAGNGILFANGVVLASGATAAPAGVTRTSAADADAGTLTATSFSYAVGTLASGGQGTVCFKAQVP